MRQRIREGDRPPVPGAAPRVAGRGAAAPGVPHAAAGPVLTPAGVRALQQHAGNAATAAAVAQRRGAPAAVQRLPDRWDPRAQAIRNMEARGWIYDPETQGFTRAPEPGDEAGPAEQAPPAPAVPQAAGGGGGLELPPSDGGTMTLALHAHKEVSFDDPQYFADGRVGHSWVTFYRDGRYHFSVGFYPAGPVESVFRSVPGRVIKDKDQPQQATSSMSVELTEEQYQRALAYIRKHERSDYHVGQYNCTDFARGVYRAATGKSAPGGTLLMPDNPNDLHAGIKKHNRKQRERELQGA